MTTRLATSARLAYVGQRSLAALPVDPDVLHSAPFPKYAATVFGISTYIFSHGLYACSLGNAPA